jgi:hypothetical protein
MRNFRPSPRRAARHVDASLLADAMARVLPTACTESFKQDRAIFLYSTLDMKREINYEALSNNNSVLGALLDANETGIFTQEDMKAAVGRMAAKLGFANSDAELEAYKLRVMLSHLRIIKRARGLPQSLDPKVFYNVNYMLGKLALEALRDQKKTQRKTTEQTRGKRRSKKGGRKCKRVAFESSSYMIIYYNYRD